METDLQKLINDLSDIPNRFGDIAEISAKGKSVYGFCRASEDRYRNIINQISNIVLGRNVCTPFGLDRLLPLPNSIDETQTDKGE